MAVATSVALASAAATAYSANRSASAQEEAARQAGKPRESWSTTNRTLGSGRAAELASASLLRNEQIWQRRQRRHRRGEDRPPAPVFTPAYRARGPSSRTTGILDAILGRATGDNPTLDGGKEYARRLMAGDRDVNPFLSRAFESANRPSDGRRRLDSFIDSGMHGGFDTAMPFRGAILRSLMGRSTPSPRDRYRGDRGELLDTEPSLDDAPRFGTIPPLERPKGRRRRQMITSRYY